MNEWKNFTSLLWYTVVTTTKWLLFVLRVYKTFPRVTSLWSCWDCVQNASIWVHIVWTPPCSNIPTMLHVLRFIHANGQLDFEVAVGTTFGHGHFVKLGLLWTVWGWMQHDLRTVKTIASHAKASDELWPERLVDTLQWSDWCLVVHLDQVELISLTFSWRRSSPSPALCLPEPTLLCSQ